jgi:hypothetical protein
LSPYAELLVARYNEALRRLHAHAATDKWLRDAGEPRDSDATDRLRVMYAHARYEVSCYAAMLGGTPENRERLDAIARLEGFDDWMAFEGDSLPCDPPPADHGAGYKPQYAAKAW